MIIKRIFIQTSAFTKSWKELGFNDSDLRRLENELLQNPKVGNVVRDQDDCEKCVLLLKAGAKAVVPEYVT